MRLEVLGSSCGHPAGGVAASGYLVYGGGRPILLDCGPGVATLLTRRPLTDLSAIFISHGHYDHCADLLTLGLCMIMMPEVPDDFRLDLYLPPGLTEKLVQVAQVLPYHDGKHANPYAHVFRPVEYQPGEEYRVGDVTVVPHGPNVHGAPAYAFRLSDGRSVLAYSGDSAPAPGLVEAARGADLFLCEGTNLDPRWSGTHSAADQVGRMAREAGTRALLLTHLTSHQADWKEQLIARAAHTFPGPVAAATAGAVYSVRPFAALA